MLSYRLRYSFKGFVLEDTFMVMLNELSLQLSNKLEMSLMKLKYTQQGVFILDKLIRGISNELINNGGSEIRTNFSKINRLIAILSCDDVFLYRLFYVGLKRNDISS